MVKKVDWDTDFFGYNVGRVDINKFNYFDESQILQNSYDFDLVYLFSSYPLVFNEFNLVDEKIFFSRDSIRFTTNNVDIIHFNPSNHSFKELLCLVYSSGQNSRFKLDTNFKNGEFEKLYEKWIRNSINQKSPSTILIKLIDNKIVGFVSYSLNDLFINIELIAVNEDYKGKGIGSELIHQIDHLANINNKTSIQVSTQLLNLSAIKLYEKNNFSLQNKSYIYHYWKQ